MLASTVTSPVRAQASKNFPNKLQDEDEDNLQLAWKKLKKTLLQSFNNWFDKFEQSFQSVLSTKRELTERLANSEAQAAHHKYHRNALEI